MYRSARGFTVKMVHHRHSALLLAPPQRLLTCRLRSGSAMKPREGARGFALDRRHRVGR
eukprot:COSAG03_NODE_3023_length_2281_cov_1.570119_4_plen_59_part_00